MPMTSGETSRGLPTLAERKTRTPTMSTGNLPKLPKPTQKEPIPTITPMTAAKTSEPKK